MSIKYFLPKNCVKYFIYNVNAYCFIVKCMVKKTNMVFGKLMRRTKHIHIVRIYTADIYCRADGGLQSARQTHSAEDMASVLRRRVHHLENKLRGHGSIPSPAF